MVTARVRDIGNRNVPGTQSLLGENPGQRQSLQSDFTALRELLLSLCIAVVDRPALQPWRLRLVIEFGNLR